MQTFEWINNISDNQTFRIIPYIDIVKESFVNPICILGMPGIADIGKFAVDQLIGILNASRVCDIIFYDYPAGAIIDNSILSIPKAEVLAYRDKHKIRDVILVTADAQAMTPKGIYEISDLITILLHRLGVKEIISLGALPGRNNDPMNIYITKTEDFDIKEFSLNSQCQKISKAVLIGANGLIPSLAYSRFAIDGTVFLTETDKKPSISEGITDLKASIQLLEFVANHYKLPIEAVFSNKKVSDLSKDLEEKRKKLEKELESYKPMEGKVEQDKTLYI
ncbi:MAG: PAC2 family protein [Candidatus Lokiarchaeota archaeon]|nr:PAC2 family protein [Candidatus Lokiarchaeota archaeon]